MISKCLRFCSSPSPLPSQCFPRRASTFEPTANLPAPQKISYQNSSLFTAVLQPGPDAGLSSISSEDISLLSFASLYCTPALDDEDIRSGLHCTGQELCSRKTLEWAAEKGGTEQQNIWLDNNPGYYSLKWTYCREDGLEVMQETLPCSWSEEIIGFNQFS